MTGASEYLDLNFWVLLVTKEAQELKIKSS